MRAKITNAGLFINVYAVCSITSPSEGPVLALYQVWSIVSFYDVQYIVILFIPYNIYC